VVARSESLRGTWRPSAETTSAFLRLSVQRGHRRLDGDQSQLSDP